MVNLPRRHMSGVSSTCLVSQDSTCLVSQDSTCLVSPDSTCLVSHDSTCQGCQEHRKLVISGTSVVAMACHGPILNNNEAMGSGKVFKYLPGLRDTIQQFKNGRQSPKITKSNKLPYILIHLCLGSHAGVIKYYQVLVRAPFSRWAQE